MCIFGCVCMCQYVTANHMPHEPCACTCTCTCVIRYGYPYILLVRECFSVSVYFRSESCPHIPQCVRVCVCTCANLLVWIHRCRDFYSRIQLCARKCVQEGVCVCARACSCVRTETERDSNGQPSGKKKVRKEKGVFIVWVCADLRLHGRGGRYRQTAPISMCVVCIVSGKKQSKEKTLKWTDEKKRAVKGRSEGGEGEMFQLGGREQEQGGRGVQTAAPLFAGFSRTTHREKWEDLPARHKNKNQMDEECILNASEMRGCVCLGMCVCEHVCVCVRACVCTQTEGVHTLHNLEILIVGRTRQLSPRTGEGVPIKERQLVMLHLLTSNHTYRHCRLHTHKFMHRHRNTHEKGPTAKYQRQTPHDRICLIICYPNVPYHLLWCLHMHWFPLKRKRARKENNFSLFGFCMWVQKRCFTLHSVAEIQRNSNVLCCAAVTCTLPLWRRSDPQAEVRASVTRP